VGNTWVIACDAHNSQLQALSPGMQGFDNTMHCWKTIHRSSCKRAIWSQDAYVYIDIYKLQLR